MRNKYLAVVALLFFVVLAVTPSAAAGNKTPPGLDMTGFAKLPVVHEGRAKPLDSFARLHLTMIYHKDSLPEMSAVSWLAELLFDQEKAYQRRIFNVAAPDILHAIGLEYRLPHYYSFSELAPALARHVDLYIELSGQPRQKLSAAQRHLVELFDAVNLYYDISRTFTAPQEWQVLPPAEDETPDETVLPSASFRIVPSLWDKDNGNWFSPWRLQQQGSASPQTQEYLEIWSAMAFGFNKSDPEVWHNSVAAAQKTIEELVARNGTPYRKQAIAAEVFYNKADLFGYSRAFYLAAFLVLLAGAAVKRLPVRKAAFALLGAGALLHMAGLVLRVYIMARPPVATLYESVIFVGLVVVLFTMVLEAKNRDGLGILIGAVLGTVLHFIGMRYAADGDSLGMLSAVLNTNFWLATHVVMITIGYGACLIAGVQAHLYLLLAAFHPDEMSKKAHLTRQMMAAGLVALFFCVLGTILGGIWADQSWGRFWGWDPKENGAMLICLWLIAMLHGRIAGMLTPPLFAMGMAFLVVVVALAWFGVNLLGVGLHSYGFTENIATNLLLFVSGELLFLLVIAMVVRRKAGHIRL